MKISLLTLLLIPVLSFAAPSRSVKLQNNQQAVCSTGELPKAFIGKYVITAEQDKFYLFVEKNQVTLTFGNETMTVPLKSCVVQGLRVVTITDPNGNNRYYNFAAFASLESKQVMLNELTETVQGNRLTIQEIILSTSRQSFNIVLQGVK